MIIIEGPDNSGKSTLASKLLDLKICIGIWHAGGPGYNTARLCDELTRLSTSFTSLHDRSNFISGPIYEQAFDKPKPNYDYKDMKKLIKSLLDLDLLYIVYCTGKGVSTKRPEEDAEYTRIVDANDKAIRFYYNDFFEVLRFHRNVITYDFNEPYALDKVISGIKKFQESFAASFTAFKKTDYV